VTAAAAGQQKPSPRVPEDVPEDHDTPTSTISEPPARQFPEERVKLDELAGSVPGGAPHEKSAETSPKSVRLVGAVTPDHLAWYECRLANPVQQLPAVYLKLSKARLTGLVVATSLGGYALAPGAFDPSLVALTCLGTGLLSAAANSINQFLEVPFDSQMDRTKNRVLVRRVIT
jgi:protoheme IX farnesyltransferase